MASLPDAPRPAAPSLFGSLVTVALVLAIAWLLAKWTWVFLAPAPVAAPAVAEGGLDLAAAARLFGAEPPPGAAGVASGQGIRLKGVVAPSPADTGAAVFNLGGKDVAVRLGADLQPGVKLVAVERDHAVIARAGVRERIDLDTRLAAALRGTGKGPAGFRLGVQRSGESAFAFSRKELDSALKDPNQLNYLGRIGIAPGGGVRLDDAAPGSLAAHLGLKPGDVITSVNGQAVASAGDLARLYQQFATTSLVQAEVRRGTGKVQLNYTIQP